MYTMADLQIDTKACANDWSISTSRACQDLVVAVEEVSQRMKATTKREQSIIHVFELWRIKEIEREEVEGERDRERAHQHEQKCGNLGN